MNNLYLVTRTNDTDYDECAGFVVVEESIENALLTDPCGRPSVTDDTHWADGQEHVKAVLIGVASEGLDIGHILIIDYRAG